MLDKEKAAEYESTGASCHIDAPGGDRIRYSARHSVTAADALQPSYGDERTECLPSRAARNSKRCRRRKPSGILHADLHLSRAMISLANQAAIESPLVSTAAIDATEFPDLVRRYNVNGVPKTIINDSLEIMGAAPETEFIAAVIQAGDAD